MLSPVLQCYSHIFVVVMEGIPVPHVSRTANRDVYMAPIPYRKLILQPRWGYYLTSSRKSRGNVLLEVALRSERAINDLNSRIVGLLCSFESPYTYLPDNVGNFDRHGVNQSL